MANLTDIRSSWSAAASEGGLTVYATTDDLPTSGLTSGDQAYVTSSSRFYISNGTGWYNVALINATPSLTISPTGSIVLSITGDPTTITLTATDSDYPDSALTFSVDSDGSFGGLATISQDSSVFTITPLSEDSATTTESTLTFKASDGISFGTGTTEFSLVFSVDDSKYTTLLLQADQNANDNQVDASTNALTITEYGNTQSTAFSPYHPGGYSNYITAAGSGYVEWSSPPTFSATAWCVETWFKPHGMPSVAVGNTGHWSIFGCWTANTNAKEFLVLGGSSGELRFYYSFDGSAAAYVDTASGLFSAFEWVHLAVSFDGTNYTLYADGVNVARVANSSQIANTNSPLSFGKSIDGASNTQTYVTGWYADGRVINGSTLESNNTFPVPTRRIDTSVANTQAVFHNKPHDRQSLTYAGSATIKRDGPYDYLGYTKANDGGAIYLDGNDYMSIPDGTYKTLGSDPWTYECWVYPTSVAAGMKYILGDHASSGSGATTSANIWLNGANFGIFCRTSAGNNINLNESTTRSTNRWYHLALVFDQTNLILYVNGQAVITQAHASGFNDGSGSFSVGRSGDYNGLYFSGYVSDVRLVKGTAVYTTNFAPPTSPLTAISGTEILTCTNKNDIWDASGAVPVLTQAGGVTALGSKSGWTGNAIYFNRSTSAYLAPGTNIALAFGTADFTIETWVFLNSMPDYMAIIDPRTTDTQVTPLLWVHHIDKYFYYYNNGATRIQSANNSVTTSTWYHVAVVRYNGVTKMYVDGTKVGVDYTDSSNYVAAGPYYIGTRYTGSNYLNGYLLDFRLTKGLARYTGNFTPPTTDFDG